jgi:hypothetical protein
MKTVPKFYQSNEEKVSAYTDADLKELSPILTVAKSMWFNEWIKQGEEDVGSCCGGKGISAWYVRPRCRSAEPVNIVHCSWVQGNISASRSVESALQYLRSKGIDCEYNDGWMD